MRQILFTVMFVFVTAVATRQERYGLPEGYIHQKSSETLHYDDSQEDPQKARFYQREVYRHALDLMEENGWKTVVDVGAGAGYKLVELLGHYTTYGIETEPALSTLRARYPGYTWIDGGNRPDKEIIGADFLPPASEGGVDLVICSDVVEHFVNPDVLLDFLRRLPYKRLIISTPDRSVLRTMEAYGEQAWTGPPVNLSHFREWTTPEFVAYLVSRGFEVESSHIGKDQPECQWHVLLPHKNQAAPALSSSSGDGEGEVYHMLGVPLVAVKE